MRWHSAVITDGPPVRCKLMHLLELCRLLRGPPIRFFQMGPLFSRKACSNSTLIIFVDRIEHLKKNKFFHILLMFVVHGFIPTLAASRRPSRSFPWPSLRRGGRFGGSPVAPSCRSTGWRSPGGPDVARSCGGHAAWRKIGNSWDENMGH